MPGINLRKPLWYIHSSLRFFEPQEHHVTRFCEEDVLVMVYEGVLRFSEAGTEYEVGPGEYFIQKKDTYQDGAYASDEPKYLYVHFVGEWVTEETDEPKNQEQEILPKRGYFDCISMNPLMEKLNAMSHNHMALVEQTALFYEILARLYRAEEEKTIADRIAEFIGQNYCQGFTLERLAEEFHFSKNHVINLFKEKYGMTPVVYQNHLRIKQAMRLLEVTSKNVESIAEECGFRDYAYFYKVFQKANKISPTEWRRQKRIKP